MVRCVVLPALKQFAMITALCTPQWLCFVSLVSLSSVVKVKLVFISHCCVLVQFISLLEKTQCTSVNCFSSMWLHFLHT